MRFSLRRKDAVLVGYLRGLVYPNSWVQHMGGLVYPEQLRYRTSLHPLYCGAGFQREAPYSGRGRPARLIPPQRGANSTVKTGSSFSKILNMPQ